MKRLLIALILILLVLGAIGGAFLGGRYSLFATIDERNAQIQQLGVEQDAAREAWEQENKFQYYWGVHDLCMWMGTVSGIQPDCQSWTVQAMMSGWYEQRQAGTQQELPRD